MVSDVLGVVLLSDVVRARQTGAALPGVSG